MDYRSVRLGYAVMQVTAGRDVITTEKCADCMRSSGQESNLEAGPFAIEDPTSSPPTTSPCWPYKHRADGGRGERRDWHGSIDQRSLSPAAGHDNTYTSDDPKAPHCEDLYELSLLSNCSSPHAVFAPASVGALPAAFLRRSSARARRSSRQRNWWNLLTPASKLASGAAM